MAAFCVGVKTYILKLSFGTTKLSAFPKLTKFLLKINYVINVELLKTSPVRIGFVASNTTCFNFEQSENTPVPIVVTLLGIYR